MNNRVKVAAIVWSLAACGSPECRIEQSTDGEQNCIYTYTDVRAPQGVMRNPEPLPFSQTFLLSSVECTTAGESDVRSANYTYNDAGHLLSERLVEGDRELYTETYTYHADGHLIQSTRVWDQSWDEEDGTTSYTQDDQGRVLTKEDGNRLRYTYDSEGRVQQTEYDIEANGTVNRRSAYVYNDDGHLLRIDVDHGASLDEGVDGTIDQTETFTTVCD